MTTISPAKAQKDFSLLFRSACEGEHITISRDDESAVLMSAKEFSSWEETMHLIKSPENIKALSDSRDDALQGKHSAHDLLET